MASVNVRQAVQDNKVTRCPDDDAGDCTNAVDKESLADSMEEVKEEQVFTVRLRGMGTGLMGTILTCAS